MDFGFFTLHADDLEGQTKFYRDIVGFKQNCDYDEFKGFVTDKGFFFNIVKREQGNRPEGINGL